MSKVYSRPKLANANWYVFWQEDGASCSYDENDTIHLRLMLPNIGVKYFYSETAHADAARLAGDNNFNGLWSVI